MTADIIHFAKDNESIKILEACQEAAKIIEAELLRWSPQPPPPEYLTLTTVGVDTLQQMAAWALARLAEQSARDAVDFAMRCSQDINKEWAL